ncbi:DUF3592 domain-containing protein [Flagellimonas sp. S174]|uniref:DUF3592 domain-containing protein n=1 Tax=Flagellimonas sp. S174 TaxID=3410790 RepID=UPI003BF53F43
MSKNKSSMWILLYSFFFALGCFLMYSAYLQYQKTELLLEKGIRTTATVTQLLRTSSSDSNTYAPVFEFKDRQKNTHSYTSKISSSPPAYDVGEKVKIVYSPKDKQNVKTISFWGLYRGMVILAMVASPLLIIGGSYLWYIYF